LLVYLVGVVFSMKKERTKEEKKKKARLVGGAGVGGRGK
jgi:hypothetical protein